MEEPTEVSRSGQATGDRRSIARRLMPFLPWIVLVILVAIGYGSVLPPSPISQDAPAEHFSAERAFVHVEAIAQQPHPMGTQAITEVRAYIVSQLENLGLSPEMQVIPARDYFGDRGMVDVVNVMARIPGTEGSDTICLMAHYDTVPATPGGNDNSAAVAAVLETGRALIAGPPVHNDVLLLFTDSEEPAPRFGSNAFVADHPAFATIGLVVNLEASGGSGASILAETSGPEHWLISEMAAADSQLAAFSFLTEATRLLGDIGTDFDPFRNEGIPGFHFAYLHGSPIYHTPADDIDAVNRGSLQHHGDHALDIVGRFGNLDLADRTEGDLVFFKVGWLLATYSASWAVIFGVLVLGYGLALAVRSTRRVPVGFWVSLRRLGKTVGVGMLTTLAATAVWFAIVRVRSTPGVVESYVYFLALLSGAIYVARRVLIRRRGSGIGVLLTWAILAFLTSVAAPGFSYLFVWPALGAAIAFSWQRQTTDTNRLLRFVLVAAPTLLLMVPAIDILLQLAHPRPGNPDSDLTYTIAIPIALGLLGCSLIATAWPTRRGDTYADPQTPVSGS